MRQATIFHLIRDAEGNQVGSQEAYGTTEDDGATITIPAGYVPMISGCQPGDIKVTVYRPSDEFPNAAYLDKTVDEEANTWTLSFDLDGA